MLAAETSEGVDKKLALHYYSRMRFAYNLLPQLTAASKESNSLSRVVSVLSAGHENRIFEDDLELKTHFSLKNAADHAITMNSFAAEELARQNPGTTFIHAFPGFVNTKYMNRHGYWAGIMGTAIYALFKPWSVPIIESGERHLYASTAAKFSPRCESNPNAAQGSDGTVGSGAYLLHWNGDITGKPKLLAEMRGKGLREKIWEHTLDIFKRAS